MTTRGFGVSQSHEFHRERDVMPKMHLLQTFPKYAMRNCALFGQHPQLVMRCSEDIL